MSKIITFGNQKGGVGKTTCTVLAANTLSQVPFNMKVCVVDIDRQKSIVKERLLDSEDYEQVLPYEVLNYNLNTFIDSIQDLDKRFDVIFVDIAGVLDESTKAITNYIDYMFVPILPGSFSISSTIDYLRFVKELQLSRDDGTRPLNLYGFVNKKRARRKTNRYLTEDIDVLKKSLEFSFLENDLNDYAIFEDINTIETIYSETSNDTAKTNLRNWIEEIYKIITNG